jgi:hypothetical protein
MISFKKASVSAIDAGGSNGTSGSVGEWAWSTSEPSPTPEGSSGTKGRGMVALVGVWEGGWEDLTEVGDCGASEGFTVPHRLAFVGRLLLGLRFGGSKRLIFGRVR